MTYELSFRTRIAQGIHERRNEIRDRPCGRTSRLTETEQPSTPIFDGHDQASNMPDVVVSFVVDILVICESGDGVGSFFGGEPLCGCRKVGEDEAAKRDYRQLKANTGWSRCTWRRLRKR